MLLNELYYNIYQCYISFLRILSSFSSYVLMCLPTARFVLLHCSLNVDQPHEWCNHLQMDHFLWITFANRMRFISIIINLYLAWFFMLNCTNLKTFICYKLVYRYDDRLFLWLRKYSKRIRCLSIYSLQLNKIDCTAFISRKCQ